MFYLILFGITIIGIGIGAYVYRQPAGESESLEPVEVCSLLYKVQETAKTEKKRVKHLRVIGLLPNNMMRRGTICGKREVHF